MILEEKGGYSCVSNADGYIWGIAGPSIQDHHNEDLQRQL